MEFLEKQKQKLVEDVARQLEEEKDVDEDRIKVCTAEVLERTLNGEYMTIKEKRELISYVLNNIKRLGVLQPILDDPSVTEVMINGPDCIFVEKNGRLYRRPERFESNKQLEDIIQKIVADVDRKVNSLNPICDARLLDGSRVNIVLSPIALNGNTITIRRFPKKVINFNDLIAWGTITKEAADFLKSCVEAKYNIFVSGDNSIIGLSQMTFRKKRVAKT